MSRVTFSHAPHQVHTVDLTFAGLPDQVFPLLCPVREEDWIEHWRCEVVHSDSGVAELGCVFRISWPEGDEVWTVSRYEPPVAIEFVRVIADSRVTTMGIALSPDRAGTTAARITVSYTALSEAGAKRIATMTEAERTGWIHHLPTMLNHYLTTGTMLTGPASPTAS